MKLDGDNPMNLRLKSVTGLLTWPLRHIRTKIIVPYAILTILLAVVGAYLVTQLVAGSLQERFDNQLAESGRVASDAVVRTEREHLQVVRAMAYTDSVPEAVVAGNGQAVEDLLAPLIVNAGVDRAEVIGVDGGRLFAVTADANAEGGYVAVTSGDAASWWPVQQTLAGTDAVGDKYASVVETDEGFVLLTAAPVYRDEEVVGAALVGTYLDSLVALVKAEALADISFYDYEGAPIASTFVLADAAEGEADLALSPEMAGSIASPGASTLRESKSLFKRDYDVAYGLLEIRDNVVGLYSVALPTNFIASAGVTTQIQVTVIFGVAMAAVLILGFFLAQLITAPILRLVTAARSVAAGELETRSAVKSDDEIGVLAHSFDQMAESLQDYTARLQRQHLSTVKALTSAIDARDPYTLGHSVRVGQLAVTVGRKIRLPEPVIEQIEIGGYLHDIGKIGVRDAVLQKPGKLTAKEREFIETHPIVGVNILESVELSPEALEFVRSHHEKLDGSGYPDGLRGDELSMVARIASVSDMYDAMTTDRPYRKAMTVDEAMAILNSEAGALLDPDVVKALEAVLSDWEYRRRTDPTLQGFRLPAAVGRAAVDVAA